MWGGTLAFAATMLIILLFIIGLFRGLSRVDKEKEKTPAEQLAGRFARGEIGEGEYLRSLAILQHGTDFVLEAERAPAPLARQARAGDPDVAAASGDPAPVEDGEER